MSGQAENTREALIADLAAHSCLFGNGEGADDCSCWPCRARALAAAAGPEGAEANFGLCSQGCGAHVDGGGVCSRCPLPEDES